MERKGISSISDVVKADPVDKNECVEGEEFDGDGVSNEKTQREQISRQNSKYVQNMSDAEKEQMRKELLENTNSKTLSILIKRSMQGKSW